jgi:predicted transposase YbfD/YdcC
METVKLIPRIFSKIEDKRLSHRIEYSLDSLLFIALCTVLCGGKDYQDMEKFGKLKRSWLSNYINLGGSNPSHDTFKRVFDFINVEHFKKVLLSHTKNLLSEITERKSISIDGKKLRGESPTSLGNKGLYLMNAYLNAERLVVGQHRVSDKSNEITALPEIIKSLEISGYLIIVDAMGCQTEVADLIREMNGEYLLQVKANQKNLLEEIEENFMKMQTLDDTQELDYGHGRIEQRRCSTLDAQSILGPHERDRWKDIQTLIRVESQRTIKNETSYESRYYISSKKECAQYFNKEIRGHWRIENNLHWVLDVVFDEDKSRVRTGNSPENMSILRKISLQCIQQVKDKNSLGKRRFMAALSEPYLDNMVLRPF